jgi:hypothetical protein
MKKTNLCLWLSSLATLGLGMSAFAQAPAAPAAAFEDPHPYQSQVMLRSSAPGFTNGMLEVIPPVTTEKYYYYTPGIAAQKIEMNTSLIYDKRIPGTLVSTAVGINYSFYNTGSLSTVAADGYHTYYVSTPFKPAIIGGVYFTNFGTNEIVMVDSFGSIWNSGVLAPAIRVAGGNYFIDTKGVLTTFRSMGAAPCSPSVCSLAGMMTRKDGVDYSNANVFGGNFFGTNDGAIVTISAVNGFTSYNAHVSAMPKTLGGNFYIGTDNLLYTVDSSGNLTSQFTYDDAKGVTHTNEKFPVYETPVLIGYSFMKFADGSFILIDGTGIPHRSFMHVSYVGSNTNAKLESSFPASIDAKSIYMPKSF